MIKTRSLLVVLFIATGLLGLGVATRASAATGGYPYASAVCSVTGKVDGSCSTSTWTINGNSADPWGYIYRNCTSYAAWKLSQGGYTMPRGARHANNWDDFFRSRGVAVNGTPAVGAIAQTDAGDFGHVAYVEAIGSGTVTVSEYNVPFPYSTYHTRTVPTSAFVYIHVHDQPPPPPPPPPPTRPSDSMVTVQADFNADGNSDVLLVTPRGPTGLNMVPLLSNGSAFTHGGLWFNTGTDYTLDQIKLAAGDFNADGNSDVLLVTPRGPSGLNFVSLLSNGTTAFSHGGLWWNTGTDYTLDQVKLA